MTPEEVAAILRRGTTLALDTNAVWSVRRLEVIIPN
jgi:hypothetical protein